MSKWKYVRVVVFVIMVFALAHLISWATIEDFDFRERGRSPVAIEVTSVTIDYDVNSRVGTATVTVNGNVEQIVITTPDLGVGSSSLTFTLLDENGVTLAQTPPIGESSNLTSVSSRVFRPSVTTLLCGTTTVQIAADAAQTQDVSATVEMYLR